MLANDPLPPRLLRAAFVLWGAAVLCGFLVLDDFSTRPGAPGAPGASWPEGAARDAARGPALDRERPTLLLFAHPHCPCTLATIEELSRLIARCPGRASVQVLVYSDEALGGEWARGTLWRRAAAIPGVAVREDPLGAAARRFGVRTSGQALLYGADGRLLFSGGLTASRGHEGDNLGRAALEALLSGREGAPSAPVFGCGLVES